MEPVHQPSRTATAFQHSSAPIPQQPCTIPPASNWWKNSAGPVSPYSNKPKKSSSPPLKTWRNVARRRELKSSHDNRSFRILLMLCGIFEGKMQGWLLGCFMWWRPEGCSVSCISRICLGSRIRGFLSVSAFMEIDNFAVSNFCCLDDY